MAQQLQQQRTPLPATIMELASTHQVGTPVMHYPFGMAGTIFRGIVFALLGIVLMLLIFFGLSIVSVGFFIIGLGFFLYAIWRVLQAWSLRGNSIYFCTDGLLRVESNHQGKKVEAVRWDQVTELRKPYRPAFWAAILSLVTIFSSRDRSSPYSTIYVLDELVIQRADGTTISIDKGFRKFKRLVKAIEQEMTNRLLPPTLAAYRAAQPIQFGEISVDLRGITLKNAAISWPELKRVTPSGGVLYIRWKQQGHMFARTEKIEIANIPNTCVFLALVSSILGGQK
jgi:hypothetical protein